jgi:phosphotransferase system HPr (HPr) family protein
MAKIEITIVNKSGLHARPAAQFVKTATSFPCEILVRNVTTESKTVNAKSILSVLTLGVNQGCVIELEANGEKADEALNTIKALAESGFGEE